MRPRSIVSYLSAVCVLLLLALSLHAAEPPAPLKAGIIGMDAHVQFSVAGQVLQGGFDGAFDNPTVLADFGGDDAPGDGDS